MDTSEKRSSERRKGEKQVLSSGYGPKVPIGAFICLSQVPVSVRAADIQYFAFKKLEFISTRKSHLYPVKKRKKKVN